MPALSRPRRRAFVWATLVAFATTAGCGTIQPVPSPPEALRAQLGTIAVVGARFPPELTLRTPSRGPLRGAGRGAARGALVTLRAGFEAGPAGGEAAALVLLLGIVLMPVGALVGALHGAATAQPTARVDAAEASLRAAAPTLRVQEIVLERLLAAGRAVASRRLVAAPGVGPSRPGESVNYASLADDGIDTVLELSVPTLAVAGPWAVDPPLEYRLTVQARLVRVSDGAALHVFAPTYASQRRSFVEWAAGDAEAFRRELDRAAALLGEAVAEEVFLIYAPPPPNPAGGAPVAGG